MRYHVGIGCSFGASEHNAHKQLAEKMNATFINLSDQDMEILESTQNYCIGQQLIRKN